jgi:phosphatidylinositol alpha-1,6-mannosyltransferase
MAVQFKPDVIFSADAVVMRISPLVAAIAPIVCFVHGNDLTSPWGLDRRGTAQELEKNLTYANRFLVFSDYVAALIRRKYADAIITKVAAGYNNDVFYADDAGRVSLRKHLALRDASATVVTCARLAPRKGHYHLLRGLLASKVAIDWIVIGQGNKRESMKLKLVQLVMRGRVRVIWLGNADDSLIRQVYNVSNVFALLPVNRYDKGLLDSEGYGLAYLEANACGLPVLGSTHGGCAEAVADYKSGRVVDPDDPKGISTVLESMLVDDNRKLLWKSDAIAWATSFCGWRRCVKSIVGELNAVVSTQP